MSAALILSKDDEPFANQTASSDAESGCKSSASGSGKSSRCLFIMAGIGVTLVCGVGLIYALFTAQVCAGCEATMQGDKNPDAMQIVSTTEEYSKKTPNEPSVPKEDSVEPWDLSKLWANLREQISSSDENEKKKHFAVLLQSGHYNPPHQGQMLGMKMAKNLIENRDQEISISAVGAGSQQKKDVQVRVVGAFMSPTHDAYVQTLRKDWDDYLAFSAPLRRLAVQEMVRKDPLISLGRWESASGLEEQKKWAAVRNLDSFENGGAEFATVVNHLAETVKDALATRHDLADLRAADVSSRLMFYYVKGEGSDSRKLAEDKYAEKVRLASPVAPLRPFIITERSGTWGREFMFNHDQYAKYVKD